MIFELFVLIFELTHSSCWFNFSVCSKQFNSIFKNSYGRRIVDRIQETHPDMSLRECYKHCVESFLINDQMIKVINNNGVEIQAMKSSLIYIGFFRELMKDLDFKPVVDEIMVEENIFNVILEYLEVYKFNIKYSEDIFRVIQGTIIINIEPW